jgi:hypothetical protein
MLTVSTALTQPNQVTPSTDPRAEGIPNATVSPSTAPVTATARVKQEFGCTEPKSMRAVKDKWPIIAAPPPSTMELVATALEFTVVAAAVVAVSMFVVAELKTPAVAFKSGVVSDATVSEFAVTAPVLMAFDVSVPDSVKLLPLIEVADSAGTFRDDVTFNEVVVTMPPSDTLKSPLEPTDNLALSWEFPIDTLPSGKTVAARALPAMRFTGVALTDPTLMAPLLLESAVKIP